MTTRRPTWKELTPTCYENREGWLVIGHRDDNTWTFSAPGVFWSYDARSYPTAKAAQRACTAVLRRRAEDAALTDAIAAYDALVGKK